MSIHHYALKHDYGYNNLASDSASIVSTDLGYGCSYGDADGSGGYTGKDDMCDQPTDYKAHSGGRASGKGSPCNHYTAQGTAKGLERNTPSVREGGNDSC